MMSVRKGAVISFQKNNWEEITFVSDTLSLYLFLSTIYHNFKTFGVKTLKCFAYPSLC